MASRTFQDKIVRFEIFDQEILELGAFLSEIGAAGEPGSDLRTQTFTAFAVLYYSVFADERPATDSSEDIKTGAAMAGLGDLAVKINRARRTPGFAKLLPHLAKMAQGAVRMNAPSSVTDEVANKNSELYVGALALAAGLEIELEDPVRSADGTNPDVLLDYEGQSWAIAVKTNHSSSPPTIFDNIRKGAQQIERSARPGIVFLNVKNILDHKALATASPFTSVCDATQALMGQLESIANSVSAAIVPEDWHEVFDGVSARPLVAIMGQSTVSAVIRPGQTMFVPIKALCVLPAPWVSTDPNELEGLDASAWRLLAKLNHELQQNPGSSEPIGT